MDRKSHTGYRLLENVILWRTQKQNILSKCSTETEYISLSSVVTEIKYIPSVRIGGL